MSDLSQEARDLIDGAIHADDPSDADRRRLRGRLAAQLGAAALASTLGAASGIDVAAASAGGGGTSAGSISAPTSGLSLGSGLFKLVVATGLASVIGGSVAWFSQAAEPIAVRAPQAAHAEVATQAIEPALAGAPTVTSLEPDQAARRSPSAAERESGRRRVDPASSLKEELALLATAQQALREGNPKLALAKAEEHRARFPKGSLREERIGIEALSRCALGHDGADVVAALGKLSPNSPLLARARQACGLAQ